MLEFFRSINVVRGTRNSSELTRIFAGCIENVKKLQEFGRVSAPPADSDNVLAHIVYSIEDINSDDPMVVYNHYRSQEHVTANAYQIASSNGPTSSFMDMFFPGTNLLILDRTPLSLREINADPIDAIREISPVKVLRMPIRYNYCNPMGTQKSSYGAEENISVLSVNIASLAFLFWRWRELQRESVDDTNETIFHFISRIIHTNAIPSILDQYVLNILLEIKSVELSLDHDEIKSSIYLKDYREELFDELLTHLSELPQSADSNEVTGYVEFPYGTLSDLELSLNDKLTSFNTGAILAAELPFARLVHSLSGNAGEERDLVNRVRAVKRKVNGNSALMQVPRRSRSVIKREFKSLE